MKRFTQRVCAAALLALGAASAYGADSGWYVGAGIGPSKTNINDGSINNELAIQSPGQTTTGITQDNKSTLYKFFVGYNVTSFVALEASMFRLGQFAFNANTTGPGTFGGDIDVWGGNVDVMGILPIDHWRIFGRVGLVYAQSTVNLNSTGATAVPNSQIGETQFGYDFGAGVGYEFDSGVAFRAEWVYYHTADGMGGNLNTNTFTGSVLYRFQ